MKLGCQPKYIHPGARHRRARPGLATQPRRGRAHTGEEVTRAHGSRQPPPGLSRCLHVHSPAREGRLAASNQGCRSQSDDTVLGTQVEPRLNRATCTGAKAMASSEAATITKVEVGKGKRGQGEMRIATYHKLGSRAGARGDPTGRQGMRTVSCGVRPGWTVRSASTSWLCRTTRISKLMQVNANQDRETLVCKCYSILLSSCMQLPAVPAIGAGHGCVPSHSEVFLGVLGERM
ncbi:hypothetical protein L1887_40480 [Cichorium endivia]|nr:hypothetical protein L1887_40480 [Cichorium endivia]